jgi:hypothetical protein
MADERKPFASIATTWHGQGVDLDKAIESAWHAAKESGAGPGTYRILDISFAAENPITEYSVIIGHI